jgi:hypothetical protein
LLIIMHHRKDQRIQPKCKAQLAKNMVSFDRFPLLRI